MTEYIRGISMASMTQQVYERETTDIVLRFHDVKDIHRLKVDIEFLLEELGEGGSILDIDD